MAQGQAQSSSQGRSKVGVQSQVQSRAKARSKGGLKAWSKGGARGRPHLARSCRLGRAHGPKFLAYSLRCLSGQSLLQS